MSFDGNVVHVLVKELKVQLENGRINKIYQLTDTDFLLVIHSQKIKHQLYISCSPSYTRVHLSNFSYDKPSSPKSFGMFLRKHIDGGIVKEIHQIENDRVIIFDIQKRNEIGDIETKHLIVEAMGRHGNIILTKEDYTIMDAIKHSLPFDGNQRTIFSGATYQAPFTKQANPYTTKVELSEINAVSLRQAYMGLSPIGSKELIHRYETIKGPFNEHFNTFFNTVNPTIVKTDTKDFFYTIDLTHKAGEHIHYESMNECLDHYYYGRDHIDRLKQQGKHIIDLIKREQKRIVNKIDKLSSQLVKTEDRDIYKIKGEMLQASLHKVEKGDTKVEVINYYTNEPMTIELDNRLSPNDNAQKYFKRYKKMKISIPYINEQIELAKNEQKFFNELQEQLNHASLKDLDEIKEELIEKKYLKRKRQVPKRKQRPQYETYIDADGIEILVGKNNLQNAYITHKVAHFTDMWFHVQNAPGSHVVVKQAPPLTETTIRTAAQLASYYSKMQNSSSVPVDYTQIRNIKKIPGQVNSFVSYTNQKTIYIDPDQAFITSLQKK